MGYSQISNRYRQENVIPPAVMYMTSWGVPPLVVTGDPPRVVSGVPISRVTVDGALLSKFRERFDLMVVVMHVVNVESYMDKTRICKSNVLKIRPETMQFKIDLDQNFLAEMEAGNVDPSFYLVALPKSLDSSSFRSLTEAEDRGAQVIATGTAVGTPPAIGSAPSEASMP